MKILPRISLNCDLGEGEAARRTRALMRYIDAANIACGSHAGNLISMARAIQYAVESGVRIGAHPGPADRESMGRADTRTTPDALATAMVQQTATLLHVARRQHARVSHIKLHGAWYHATETDAQLRAAYLDAVAEHFPKLEIFAPSGGKVIAAAQRRGLRVKAELFADRAYLSNGQLLPRSTPSALLHGPQEVISRLAYWFENGHMITHDNQEIALSGQTLCIHSDTHNAVRLARVICRLIDTHRARRLASCVL